ncbi:MAG: NfeD family protein [Nocardioides sp.]|uniref:NfeD family protein n=1 Tax=Nocardioides sp. TaxID=35761 RepID=UPI003F05F79C
MFEWMRDHAWESWLAAAMLLGIAEMLSLDLIMIMLAAGAVVGMVAALAGLPVVAQVLMAAVAAVAMIGLVRPGVLRKLHTSPHLAIGHTRLVGAEGVVLAEVTTNAPGRIKVAGEEWTAQPYDSSLTIGVGEAVEVLEIKGATAYVHPVAGIGS